MEFRMGREDAESDADVAPADRLPMADEGVEAHKSRWDRMGLSDRDLVALSGAHSLGFIHDTET